MRVNEQSRTVSTMRLLYIVPSVVLCKVAPESKRKSQRCRWLSFIDRRKVLNVNGWKKNKQKKKFYRKRHAQPTRFRWIVWVTYSPPTVLRLLCSEEMKTNKSSDNLDKEKKRKKWERKANEQNKRKRGKNEMKELGRKYANSKTINKEEKESASKMRKIKD